MEKMHHCAHTGKEGDCAPGPGVKDIDPKDSRTCATKLAEAEADKCPFNLYLSKIKGGGNEGAMGCHVGEKGLLLDHNHPTQTPSQKKLLAKLHLTPEDLSMVLDLGKSFVPPRNIVEFMRKRGYHNITPKHIHNLFEEQRYSSAYDAHELLTRLEKKRDVEGWCVDFKRDCEGRLSHVF